MLNALGTGVLGGPLDKLLIIAVLTSASASTQTTILPTARTTLSMAHWKAVTSLLSRVHKRYLTPTVSTLGFGALSIAITIVLLLLSASVLEDSLTAIGFPICFYYGFTGVACGFYYRRELTESARNFLLLGLGPLIGGLMLFGIGIKAAFYYGHAGKRLIQADPRHHAAAVDGHRRHAPRRHHHARSRARTSASSSRARRKPRRPACSISRRQPDRSRLASTSERPRVLGGAASGRHSVPGRAPCADCAVRHSQLLAGRGARRATTALGRTAA